MRTRHHMALALALAASDLFHAPKSEPPPVTVKKRFAKSGRNDPCPCGSGRKFKKCCIYANQPPEHQREQNA